MPARRLLVGLLLLAVVVLALAAPASAAAATPDADDDDFDDDAPARAPEAPQADDDEPDDVAHASPPEAHEAAKAIEHLAVKDDELDYDEDEFEGFTPKKHRKPAGEKRPPPPKPPVPRTYTSEIVYGSLIVFYVIYFCVGLVSNNRTRTAWVKAVTPFLQEQFAYVDSGTERESFSSFYLTASGRVNVKGARFFLDLVKRQDFTNHLFSMFGSTADQVTLDMILDDMSPFVLAVCRRGQEKKLREAFSDLKRFATETRTVHEHAAITDCPSLVAQVLCDDVSRLLRDNADLFVSLHVTDQPSIFTSRNVLRLVMRVPPAAEMHRATELVRMALLVADRAAKYEASRPDRQYARTLRADAADEERKKNQEEKAKQKPQMSSEEARRRMEEKEAKRRAKLLTPKIKSK
eukprot:m51a1_g10562 putative coiled-coil domain containing protein (407) ;mRNA; f:11266-12761